MERASWKPHLLNKIQKGGIFQKWLLCMKTHLECVHIPTSFENLCKAQPIFKCLSTNTMRSDILKLYEDEIQKTMRQMDVFRGRVTITMDMCTNDNTFHK